MHQTSDTLYFKEYNLVIKHGLPLKLELIGFVDACPPKITMSCIYFNKSFMIKNLKKLKKRQDEMGGGMIYFGELRGAHSFQRFTRGG